MHRALQIPEIVEAIMIHVDAGSFFAAALTCRAFFEPAIAEGYEQIDVQFPPGFARVLLDRPNPDVDRFLFYSSKVRQLHVMVDYRRFDLLNKTISDVAGVVPNSTSAFPNLKRLYIEFGDTGFLAALLKSPFMSSSLEELILDCDHHLRMWRGGRPDFDASTQTFVEALHLIANTTGHLRDFAFLSERLRNPKVIACLVKVIRANPHLRSVRTNIPIDTSLFQALGKLTVLTTLGLSSDEANGVNQDDSGPIDKSYIQFPSVDAYELRITSVFRPSSLSAWLITSQLQSLSVYFRLSVHATPNDVDAFGTLVSVSCVALTYLHLSILNHKGDSDPPGYVGFEVPSAFLACSGITTFKFYHEADFSKNLNLQDKHLEEISVAWPLLEVIDIRFGDYELVNRKGLTMWAFASLARNCRQLRSIGLSYWDMEEIPPVINVPSDCNMLLTMQYCKPTRDMRQDRIGQYLGALWPRITFDIMKSYLPILDPDGEREHAEYQRNYLEDWKRAKAWWAGVKAVAQRTKQ